jgi:anti-anti-sigma factor
VKFLRADAEPRLEIRKRSHGRSYLLQLFGELDLASADEMDRELRQAEASGAPTVVVDLAGLEFIDSTGIRLLLEAHRRSQTNRHGLALTRGSDAVQRTLEVCGLVRHLRFLDDAST